MPIFCEEEVRLGNLTNTSNCEDKSAITQAAWFRISDLNKGAITTETEGDSEIITSLPMMAGATMYKIDIDSAKTTFKSNRTGDSSKYDWIFNTDMTGFTADQINLLCGAFRLCDLGLWIKVGCKEVVAGVNNNNGVFESNYKSKLSDHNIEFGGDNSNVNSFSISGSGDCAFECANIGYENLPIAE